MISTSSEDGQNDNGHTRFHNPVYGPGDAPRQSNAITQSKGHNNSRNVEEEYKRNDQADYDKSTNYENAAHHEDIKLEHDADHPGNNKPNHQTMTRGTSAVLNSYSDLPNVGTEYEHLHPQGKDSDHYTNIHGGNLHEKSHDHGNHILEERRKSRSGHVEFH